MCIIYCMTSDHPDGVKMGHPPGGPKISSINSINCKLHLHEKVVFLFSQTFFHETGTTVIKPSKNGIIYHKWQFHKSDFTYPITNRKWYNFFKFYIKYLKIYGIKTWNFRKFKNSVYNPKWVYDFETFVESILKTYW